MASGGINGRPGRSAMRVRATRLGWATRERAELELKRVAGAATVRLRELHDESWALVWPDGRVSGRFGTILPHEQRWA